MNLALCAAQQLPEGDVPEWVHLLPLGPSISTRDKRGPYRLADPARVVAASQQAAQGSLAVIDENHSTDVAAPAGLPAPARGWIVDYQLREDGIWGKVDWNAEGRALVASRAYRGISPVIQHDGKNTVLAILRASLINKPNLKGLTALSGEGAETTMDETAFLAALREALGLADDTDHAAILDAVKTASTQSEAPDPAAFVPIATFQATLQGTQQAAPGREPAGGRRACG